MTSPRDPSRLSTHDLEVAVEPGAALRDCRNAIEEVDRRIVALLAERMTLCLRAATAKRNAALPIVDPVREAEVLRSAQALAAESGLPPEPVREIFERIVALARRAQLEER